MLRTADQLEFVTMTLPKQGKESKQPSTKAARREVSVCLRVICLGPPKPERYDAEFGLQDNSTTSDWVIHPGVVQPSGDIHFECECRVRPNQRTNTPSFLGPFVHGETAKRFLYLSW